MNKDREKTKDYSLGKKKCFE